MRSNTGNRIATIQSEIFELTRQNELLEQKIPYLQNKLAHIQNQLKINGSDKVLLSELGKVNRELGKVQKNINKNNARISSLKYKVYNECQKAHGYKATKNPYK